MPDAQFENLLTLELMNPISLNHAMFNISKLSKLEDFVLSDFRIATANSDALFNLISQLPSLKFLELLNCKSDPVVGWGPLLNAISQSKTLEEAKLAIINLRVHGFKHINDFIASNKTLLKLSVCLMYDGKDKYATTVFRALAKNESLLQLDLRFIKSEMSILPLKNIYNYLKENRYISSVWVVTDTEESFYRSVDALSFSSNVQLDVSLLQGVSIEMRFHCMSEAYKLVKYGRLVSGMRYKQKATRCLPAEILIHILCRSMVKVFREKEELKRLLEPIIGCIVDRRTLGKVANDGIIFDHQALYVLSKRAVASLQPKEVM